MSATRGSAAGLPGATDRVLPSTRALSIVIIPFLLAAFVLLYFWPSADDTARLFAWRITPGFTSMMLAAVYLGGAYFFLRVDGRTSVAPGRGRVYRRREFCHADGHRDNSALG